jgi:hypothetical protein
MTHPTDEEWVAYLYGELPRASKAALREHLRTCAACQTEVTIWANAKESLGAWKLSPRCRALPVPTVLAFGKWALAALVVLGLGFMIGRLSQINHDSAVFRAALVPQLKAALVPELRREMQVQLAADCRAVLAGDAGTMNNDLRRQLRTLLDQTEAKAVKTSTAQTQRALLEFAESYRTDRDQAQQKLLTLFDRAEQARDAQYLSLRRALETVAVVADDKFQRTESRLGELASYAETKLISDRTDSTP